MTIILSLNHSSTTLIPLQRLHVKFSNPAPIKNKVMRHKTRDESQFRVHFFIRSVHCDSNVPTEQFLEGISSRLSKFLPVANLQIANPSKRFVDISVGAQNDASVLSFIDSGRRVILPGENGNPVEHDIVISDSFLTYCRARKETRMDDKNDSSDHHRSSYSSSSYGRRRDRDRERSSKRRRHDRNNSDDEIRLTYIWIFCIPIDCKEREIFSSLSEKGLRVKSYDWKIKEDMEFLQVELSQTITLRQLQEMDCKVDNKYPLLIIPRQTHIKFVDQHILMHELEINFERDVEEVELIKMVFKIGGILAMVKDQFYGPKKYVVAVNSTARIEFMKEQLSRKYKNCYFQRPKFPLRLGRLEKCFTFAAIVDNLASYEEEM